MKKHIAVYVRVSTKRQDQRTVLSLRNAGGKDARVAAIARATQLSRPTVYRILADQSDHALVDMA